MKVKIRLAKRSELGDVARLLKRVFSAPPWNEKWTIGNALKAVKSYSKNGKTYVAVLDGKMVGGLIVNEGHYVDGPFIEVEELFVDAKLHGKGIGSALLERVESDYSKKGFVTIYVTTMRKCPAFKFYDKRGFRESYFDTNLEKKL